MVKTGDALSTQMGCWVVRVRSQLTGHGPPEPKPPLPGVADLPPLSLRRLLEHGLELSRVLPSPSDTDPHSGC
jgi:hypothetical protein